MEKFIIGVALGGLAGALLTANNYKMRILVKKGQEEVQAKLDKIIDEKIEMMEEGVESVKEEVKEKKDAAMDKVRKAGKSSSKKENA
jgi:esterase/lipase